LIELSGKHGLKSLAASHVVGRDGALDAYDAASLRGICWCRI